MTPYRRFSNTHQMAASVLAFVCVALLLESGGLYDWAQRLELGPERRVALPIATALHRTLGKLGLERERKDALRELARLKWSDDPAALAEADTPGAPPIATPSSTAMPNNADTPTTPDATPSSNAPTKPPPTPGRDQPILGILPDAPPLLSKLPEIDAVDSGETRTIALAGDSMMAVGLSSTILRLAPKYKDLAFLKTFKSGTGLARPEVFNWQAEYPAMLKAALPGGASPDFVLVAIGANDGQGFVQDGITYPFGTDGWKTIYQQRVSAYLQMLESGGATVVWLGLPPMKSDTYDAHIALVNRIDAAVVKASPNAIWFSTAGIIGDAGGRFRDFGEVNGSTVRLRQGDGIHLSDDGAALIAARLLPWLAAQKPGPAVNPSATPEPPQP